MTQPQTQTPAPQAVPASVPYAPAPTPQVASVPDPKTPRTRTPKPPAWYRKPQFVAVGGLLLVILLLLGYHFLGPLVLAAIVLALGAVGFFAALAWRRKGRNAAGAGGRQTPRAARPGGLGARLAAMRAGRSTGAVGPVRAGGTAGRLAGLRSKLPRALGGTRARSTGTGGPGRSTSSGPGGPGRSTRSSRNPFSRTARAVRSEKRAARRSTSGAGRSISSGGGAPGKPGSAPKKSSGGGFGRAARGAVAGVGRAARAATRRGGSSKPGASSGGESALRPGGATKPGAKPTTKPTGSKWSTSSPTAKATELAKAFWGGVKQGAAPKHAAKPDPKTATTGDGRPHGSKPSPRPRGADGQPTPASKPTQTTPERPATRGPKHSAGPSTNTTGGNTMTDIQFSDDQSLQRWGANLGGTSTAADEVARLFAEAEAAKAHFNAIFGRIANQAESELPTSPTLVADVQVVKSKADAAASADEWRAVAADAEQLPARYRREHETDQDRLNSPRVGIAQEKRADVTAATQDN